MSERNEEQNTSENGNFVPETKSGFIDGIVKAFDIFVGTFKKNSLLTVTFILTLFMLLNSFVLHPIDINKIVTETLQKEDQVRIELVEKSIQQRFEADKMINQLMNELVEDFDVNRAMMFELHNGSKI